MVGIDRLANVVKERVLISTVVDENITGVLRFVKERVLISTVVDLMGGLLLVCGQRTRPNFYCCR